MKYLLVLFSLVFFLACNDDDNPSAPAGAQAKTITFTVAVDDWERTGPIAAYEKVIPELTQAIAEKGAVLVYKRSVAEDVWTLWDISIVDLEAGYSYTYFSSYSPESLVLGVLMSGTEDVPGVLQEDNLFKVVLVSNPSAIASIKKEDLSYEMVKKKLFLIE